MNSPQGCVDSDAMRHQKQGRYCWHLASGTDDIAVCVCSAVEQIAPGKLRLQPGNQIGQSSALLCGTATPATQVIDGLLNPSPEKETWWRSYS